MEFRSELEELKWVNRQRKAVTGLYVLRVEGIAQIGDRATVAKEIVFRVAEPPPTAP